MSEEEKLTFWQRHYKCLDKIWAFFLSTFLSRIGKGEPTSSWERASQGHVSSPKIFWRKWMAMTEYWAIVCLKNFSSFKEKKKRQFDLKMKAPWLWWSALEACNGGMGSCSLCWWRWWHMSLATCCRLGVTGAPILPVEEWRKHNRYLHSGNLCDQKTLLFLFFWWLTSWEIQLRHLS